MADDTPNPRYSNNSTLSLSTRPPKDNDSTRSENRRTHRSSKPIEAISEVAINFTNPDDKAKQHVTRFHSAPPETASVLPVSNNNISYEKHNGTHRKTTNGKRSSVEKPPVTDAYQLVNKPESSHQGPPPYGSPELHASRPALHYVSGGHVNQAYVGSQMTNQFQQNQNMMNTNRVQREQYWSWPCCQQSWNWNWTRREKTFALIILIQSFIIGGLVIALLKVILNDGDIIINTQQLLAPRGS